MVSCVERASSSREDTARSETDCSSAGGERANKVASTVGTGAMMAYVERVFHSSTAGRSLSTSRLVVQVALSGAVGFGFP